MSNTVASKTAVITQLRTRIATAYLTSARGAGGDRPDRDLRLCLLLSERQVESRRRSVADLQPAAHICQGDPGTLDARRAVGAAVLHQNVQLIRLHSGPNAHISRF